MIYSYTTAALHRPADVRDGAFASIERRLWHVGFTFELRTYRCDGARLHAGRRRQDADMAFVCGYCRSWSLHLLLSDGFPSGQGLEAQLATISRFAEAEAFNVVETFTETRAELTMTGRS